MDLLWQIIMQVEIDKKECVEINGLSQLDMLPDGQSDHYNATIIRVDIIHDPFFLILCLCNIFEGLIEYCVAVALGIC